MTKSTVKLPRILFVGPVPPPDNGMTLVAHTLLSSSLRDRFHLVHADTSDHRDLSNVNTFDVRNVALALLHGLSYLWLLVARRIDLCYVPIARDRLGFLRDALFLAPTRVLRRRCVIHFHSTGFMDFFNSERGLMRWLVDFCMKGVSDAIVPTEDARGDFARWLAPDRVHVVHNGVRDYGPGIDPKEREPVVLHLGAQWREKGTFDLLEAARGLRERCSGARIVLAGSWVRDTEEAEARELIERLGLGEMIVEAGRVSEEEKAELLRSAAALAFPSRSWEGHPLVVMEALSAGTPPVCSRLGALPSIIVDGENGFLIDEGDTPALADRLLALLGDTELRDSLSRGARDLYQRSYTQEAFGRRVGEIWELALKRAG